MSSAWRALKVMVTLGLVAGVACATSAGPGGYVYWSSGAGGAGKVMLYRAAVDGSWAVVGSVVNFDNVANNNTTNVGPFNRDVEVLDPRSEGGTGKLLVAADYNDTPYAGSANSGQAAYDIVRVDPNNPTTVYSRAAGNLYTDGKLATSTNTTWNTVGARLAVPAPQNWLGASGDNSSFGGVSMVTEGYSAWYGNLSYIHDQNANGWADCATGNTAEGAVIGNASSAPAASGQPGDLEFGSDRALYTSYAAASAGPINVKRYWVQNGTTLTSSVYYSHDNHADGLGASYFYGGGGYIGGSFIATGPGYTNVNGLTNTNPIVYLFTVDNHPGWSAPAVSAIFAMQDSVNGDNVVSTLGGSPDTFKEIWRSGDAGITINATGGYSLWDIELVFSGGKRTLLFMDGNGSGKLYALSLADNGLAVDGAGTLVLSGVTGSVVQGQGFEFDANPAAAVPEPATLLLLGTGALGALRYIRRQRMS